MKKMNKMYEAPKAEVIEMLNNVVVVMSAGTATGGGNNYGGGEGDN
jgi:hypothetical protein